MLVLAVIPSEENFVFVGTIDHRTELFAESVAGDHVSCDSGGALKVVGSTGGNIAEDDCFRNTAAEEGAEFLFHIAFGNVVSVLNRKAHGVTAGIAPRTDGDFVNRILAFAEIGYDCVTCFMVGGKALILIVDLSGFLFRTGNNLDGRFLDFLHGDCLFLASCGKKSGFVRKVFKLCAGEARGGFCNYAKVNVRTERFVLCMDFKNRFASLNVRCTHYDLAVETSGSEKSRVKDIRAVGCRHNDDSGVVAETVHLNKELVKGLFAFIMSAAETCASVTADCVDFIDENNCGGILFCFAEKVANTACADADEHFNKVGTGNGEERNSCFAGNRPCKKGFTGTGLSHKENALRDSCAEGIEAVRVFEEFNDFLKLLFFLVAACNIRKGCGFVAGFILIFRLGEIHCLSAALLTHHEKPEHSHCADKEKGRNHGDPPWSFLYREVIRLCFGCGNAVLLVYYIDIGEENGNVRNKIFNSLAFFLPFGGFLYKGEFAGSEIEGIAFDFGIFKHLEHFVIFKLHFLFLVHGEHKGNKEKQQNKRRDV